MNIPRMSYPQYRKARRLTHECCNYCNGNCLLLDDGEECVCVQSISYSLLCRWFKVAVLPLDAALCAEITKGRDEIKGFSAWSAGRWIKLSCSPQNRVLNAGKWTKKKRRDKDNFSVLCPG